MKIENTHLQFTFRHPRRAVHTQPLLGIVSLTFCQIVKRVC